MAIKPINAKIGADPGVPTAILYEAINEAIGKAIFCAYMLDFPEFWLRQQLAWYKKAE